MNKKENNSRFRKHFRIYFLNNHPAYIVDEDGNMYVFHRLTHSKTSGGRNNIEIENPLVNDDGKPSFMVKKAEKDKKGRFSLFELKLKPYIDLDNFEIKKAGGSQAEAMNNITTSINRHIPRRRKSSIVIKTKKNMKNKKKVNNKKYRTYKEQRMKKSH